MDSQFSGRLPANTFLALFLLPIVLVFSVGYWITVPSMGAYSFLYLLLNAVACLSACITAVYLLRDKMSTAAWLVYFVVLIFGYFKFYWIVLSPEIAQSFFPKNFRYVFASSDSLFSAFCAYTLAFTAFCASLLLSSRYAKIPKLLSQSVEEPLGEWRSATRILTGGICILLPILVYLVCKYKVGVLGMPSAPLPLHLSGIIFYSQIIALPVLIISQIYAAHRSGELIFSRGGVGLLLVWALADAVLRTSRASLLLVPLLVLFLSLSGGLKIRRSELWAMFGFGGLAVFSLPLITEYRILRMSGVDSIGSLAYIYFSFAFSIKKILSSMAFLLFRVPGIETIILILGLSGQPLGLKSLGVMFSADGLSGYLTGGIMGTPVGQPIAYAVSFFGGAYLAGGYLALILASALVGVISIFGWRLLNISSMRTLPVMKAFFLLLLFWCVTEGPSPILFKQAVVSIAVIAVCEVLFRNASKIHLLLDWRRG